MKVIAFITSSIVFMILFYGIILLARSITDIPFVNNGFVGELIYLAIMVFLAIFVFLAGGLSWSIYILIKSK